MDGGRRSCRLCEEPNRDELNHLLPSDCSWKHLDMWVDGEEQHKLKYKYKQQPPRVQVPSLRYWAGRCRCPHRWDRRDNPKREVFRLLLWFMPVRCYCERFLVNASWKRCKLSTYELRCYSWPCRISINKFHWGLHFHWEPTSYFIAHTLVL